ncbi:LysR family transcriptional regulator [Thalassobius sp. Cn5-15]|uniref:helix-turn-helix domain-containing protein n=1 Tax=Thalassobius sp. Cn5-15 TaxID=2917763 RepID=UPI001EF2FF5E|nr:LysR family transcriptional regulator [Thalassobius sp. Cn5-15]MCG7493775.1 LysR family transcriptional regulator [Thalassobius sp. Cn5-15]
MAELKNHPLLFEMLRSFTTLAGTLNLSRAVEQLGSTRQTVRRHIATLEEIKGERLFLVDDRQYHLSEAGRHALQEAQDLQERGLAWLNNEAGHREGLYHIFKTPQDGWYFYLQQHGLGDLWSDESALLRAAVQCWAAACGDITHEALAPIRDFLMVFRRASVGWVCSGVGSKSSYASWYGQRWEYSAIGREVPLLPGGQAHAAQLHQPFEEIRASGGLRYDHVHTRMDRGEFGMNEPISFKRLLLGCRYPDGSFALASLVVRSHNLRIHGLSQEEIERMPASLIMDDLTPD